MKHSEFTPNQNFGIQISPLEINKSFSLTEQGISVSNPNSNTLMINSVIPTHININSGAILNTTLNNQRSINLPEVKNYNLAIVAKPNSSSNATINSNLVSPLTFHPNNTIKLVNFSKCHQISSINKDNSSNINNNSNVHNNTINVQFVSNPSSSTGTESSIGLQPSCKIDSITLNANAHMTTCTTSGTINQPVSTNSSSSLAVAAATATATRFVIQGPSTQFLTLIPQTSDMANSSMANNHLIKNPKYVLTGNKQQHQTIRPIITGSTSSVVSQNNISKQPINIISPSKAINNFGPISAFNMSEMPNQTVIQQQDPSANRGLSLHNNDSQRCSKNLPVKIPLQSYSVSTNNNNNIRLALTSSINNSRGTHTNQSKIQLISPKSRKRSGSPLNLLQDVKNRNPTIGSKNENFDNSLNYNNQIGNYSPTRKRARKQHLKSVNTKSQKPIINQKLLLNNKIEPNNHLNNIRPALNEKIMSATVVVPSNATKVSNVSFQNKLDDNLSTQTTTPINAQIIFGIKNPIQICPSKTSSSNQSLPQRPTSIFTTNSTNNIIGCNSGTTNSNTTITPISQFQIIGQNPNIKQIQLSPNFILSSKIKCQTPFSPSKVIHIAPSLSTINRTTPLKNEILVTESVPVVVSEEKPKTTTEKAEKLVEPIKSETADVKLEILEDPNVKISLFPVKYHWNPRRNHFWKKSDVKFKKSKSNSNTKFNSNLLNPENIDDVNSNADVDIGGINWFLYKAFCQILMQKKFDEENLQKIYQLKERFDIFPQIDDLSRPIFRKICAKTQFYAPIPDQIDIKCLSKYTDPQLFGISGDIIGNYVNSLSKTDISEISEESFPNSISHECDTSCLFYSLEVPPTTPPKKFSKIIDLIEGLIVKEKNIIEKESEINSHFIKFLRHTSDFTSQNKKSPNKTNNHTERFKLFTGYRR